MGTRERLEDYKKATNFSAAMIAEKVEMSAPTVLKWLHGKIEPRLDEAVRLARVIGCTLDDLAGIMNPGERPSDIEQVVLDAYRRSGLPPDEAVRALHDRARDLFSKHRSAPNGDMARTTVQSQDDRTHHRKAN